MFIEARNVHAAVSGVSGGKLHPVAIDSAGADGNYLGKAQGQGLGGRLNGPTFDS